MEYHTQRELTSAKQAIQRLTRENHDLTVRLRAAVDACADREASVRMWQDKARKCAEGAERTNRELCSALAELCDERARRRAAEAALQALSASKIRWGTLALGWCLGAATVLVWAFW